MIFYVCEGVEIAIPTHDADMAYAEKAWDTAVLEKPLRPADDEARIDFLGIIMLGELDHKGYAFRENTGLTTEQFFWIGEYFGEPLDRGNGLVSIVTPTTKDGIPHPNPALTHRAVPVHNDLVYSSEPSDCLLLMCVDDRYHGGETEMYDARCAAQLFKNQYPELSEATIRFTKGQKSAEWPLIRESKGMSTLWYRVDPDGICMREAVGYDAKTSQEIIATIDGFVSGLEPDHSVRLNEGDLLLIDNTRYLHSRRPFQGERRLLRMILGDNQDNYK